MSEPSSSYDEYHAIPRVKWGIFTAVLFNILYAPIHIFATFNLIASSQSYETYGNPYETCHSAASSCTGPNGLLMALSILAILAGGLLAAWAGCKVGRFRNKRKAMVIITASSLAFWAVLVAGLIALLNSNFS